MSASNPTRRRIGQVVDMLREEFPDVSVSKLRFLEDRGIVVPERTPGGYRMYAPSDVSALRMALRMQRDEFMPLRVIKDELRRRMEAGGQPGTTASARRVPGVLPVAGELHLGSDQGELVSAEALVRAAGATHEFLEECRGADIVSGQRGVDGVVRYSVDEVGLVTGAWGLHRLGLDVRHLRQSAMAMGRQGALVEQYAAALLRAPGVDSRERALATVEVLTQRLAEFMRIAFVRDVKLMTARATGLGDDRSGVEGGGTAPRAVAAGITHA